MTDTEFMTNIITEICEYAVKNNMEPDDTLRTLADNILMLLEISSFNNFNDWESAEGCDFTDDDCEDFSDETENC